MTAIFEVRDDRWGAVGVGKVSLRREPDAEADGVAVV